MPRLGAVGKLNELYELFTRVDGGKLTSGDVEALAGYFKGLPDSAKAKARKRIVAIYRSSAYSVGMKARFKKALLDAGLTPGELSPSSVLAPPLDKPALVASLKRLSDDGEGAGLTKTITLTRIPTGAQPFVKAAIEALKRETVQKDPNSEFGDPLVKVIFSTPRDAGAAELIGFTVEQPVYTEDHEADRRLYFAPSGEQVGDEYVGE